MNNPMQMNPMMMGMMGQGGGQSPMGNMMGGMMPNMGMGGPMMNMGNMGNMGGMGGMPMNMGGFPNMMQNGQQQQQQQPPQQQRESGLTAINLTDLHWVRCKVLP